MKRHDLAADAFDLLYKRPILAAGVFFLDSRVSKPGRCAFFWDSKCQTLAAGAFVWVWGVGKWRQPFKPGQSQHLISKSALQKCISEMIWMDRRTLDILYISLAMPTYLQDPIMIQ